jgi:predicted alpha/beta superfamily hydrolase
LNRLLALAAITLAPVLIATGGCANSKPAPATSAITAPAPTTSPSASEPRVTIPRTRQFDLRSRAGRVYRIMIAEPIRPVPATGAPVVYVLDANAFFASVMEASRFQKNLTPAVIVGIGYPTDAMLDPDRRYYDYTPLTPPEKLHQSPNEPQVKPGGTGGQDEFLSFIEDELKPEVRRRLEGAVTLDLSRQALLGHSLAGRFVLHALFKRSTFQTYVALSPSIWWGENSVLEGEPDFRHVPLVQPTTLIISVGDLEQRVPPGTPPERAAFLGRARMVDNASELASRLKGIPFLDVRFTVYTDENHGSVVPTAVSRGLRAALAPTRSGS